MTRIAVVWASTVTVFAAGFPAAAAAGPGTRGGMPSGWNSYGSDDGSCSFGYPDGWDVKRQGKTFRLRNNLRKEAAQITLGGTRGDDSLETLARSVIAGMRKSLPRDASLRSKAAGGSGNRFFVRFALDRKGKRIDGLGLVAGDAAELVTWYAYTTPAAEFSEKRGKAFLETLARSMVRKTISPERSARAPRAEAPASPGIAGPGPKDDKFFWSGGKAPQALYRGVIMREYLSSTLETGIKGGVGNYASTTVSTSGGDFEAAFYPDGTMRAVWVVIEMIFGNTSKNRFLKYEGKFTVRPDGTFETGEMERVEGPTEGMYKDDSPKMTLKGRYLKEQDIYRIPDVRFFDSRRNRWDKYDFNSEAAEFLENKDRMLVLRRPKEQRKSFGTHHGETRGFGDYGAQPGMTHDAVLWGD